MSHLVDNHFAGNYFAGQHFKAAAVAAFAGSATVGMDVLAEMRTRYNRAVLANNLAIANYNARAIEIAVALVAEGFFDD